MPEGKRRGAGKELARTKVYEQRTRRKISSAYGDRPYDRVVKSRMKRSKAKNKRESGSWN